MTPQRQFKYSQKIMMPVVISIAACLFLFGSPSWGNGGEGARGDPVLTNYVIQALNEGKSMAKDFKDLEFLVFTSSKGDYRFEVPKAWASPTSPHDPTFEAIFVGPIAKAHHLGVFLTVGHYPQDGQVVSLDGVFAQFQREMGKKIISTETLLIDQHAAHLLRIHEQVSVPLRTYEKVAQFIIWERIALIEKAGEIYVLHYISSPELYEENLPVFEHLLTSFHFTSGNS